MADFLELTAGAWLVQELAVRKRLVSSDDNFGRLGRADWKVRVWLYRAQVSEHRTLCNQ